MKKLSKFLSIVLALITVLTLAVPAFAVTTINRVDITIASDLRGKTPNQWATYMSSTTANVTLNSGGLTVYDYTAKRNPGGNETYVEGHTYNLTPYFKVKSGYVFDTKNVKVYVNGSLYTDFYFEEGNNTCLNLNYKYKCTNPAKEINRVDITFDNIIAGKTASDYKDYYTFSAAHCSYYTDSTSPAVEIYDEKDNHVPYDTKLVANERYCIESLIVADAGYRFGKDLEVYVNGEKVEENYFYAKELKTGPYAGYEILCVENYVTVEKEPNFFVKLIRAIINFFSNLFSF